MIVSLVQNKALKKDRETDYMPQLDKIFSAPVGWNINISLYILLYPNQVIHMKTYVAFVIIKQLNSAQIPDSY